jgi:DNA-binding response OmpR family regulator
MDERSPPRQPAGEGAAEVVVLDGDERVREPLASLLSASGLLVTATADADRVIALATEKYFAVALIDVDTPEPDRGFAILPQIKRASPATRLVLLSNRQTFDVATRGFHAGADDVVAKAPQSVRNLVDEVVRACRESARRGDRDQVLRETLEVHELFLKKLMEASRKALQAEETARGGSGPHWELKECVVLVVDENPRTAQGLQEALARSGSYRCLSACNGGEALDLAGQQSCHLALVNERLPDLPVATVVKGLRSQMGDGIVMVFSHPTSRPGRLALVDEHREITLVAELARGEQLVNALQEMREAYLAKSRERRYLQAFRQEHYEFLKRYVELRQKLLALVPREE